MNTHDYSKHRKGNVLILSAILMIVMFAMLAFAVDVGYLCMVRTELQRTADSAAIAATWSLLDGEIATGQKNSPLAVNNAQTTAAQFSSLNKVLDAGPLLGQSDVLVGYLTNPSDHNEPLNPSSSFGYNAVQVCVQRTSDQNGVIPLFFARALGIDQEGSKAKATAAFLNNISGFRVPSDGSNLNILPFALDQRDWDALIAGQGPDQWSYDSTRHNAVSHGQDGIQEVNLYPGDINSPGNCGTIDIGSADNSTSDITRQILDGISAEDMGCLGGELTLPATINGDTGISAGLKSALISIIGEPRILPLYSTVYNPGNNAQYTIVRFVGVRIMYVKLNASMQLKQVVIQPASVLTKG
ncbi:MAG: pilus assembly protein TadG-related protein, partial [Thermoguttaceae bacterium]